MKAINLMEDTDILQPGDLIHYHTVEGPYPVGEFYYNKSVREFLVRQREKEDLVWYIERLSGKNTDMWQKFTENSPVESGTYWVYSEEYSYISSWLQIQPDGSRHWWCNGREITNSVRAWREIEPIPAFYDEGNVNP